MLLIIKQIGRIVFILYIRAQFYNKIKSGGKIKQPNFIESECLFSISSIIDSKFGQLP